MSSQRAILLVTGSRAYPGSRVEVEAMVREVLEDFARRHQDAHVLILIHGDCPHRVDLDEWGNRPVWSIDRVAEKIGRSLAFRVLSRPVDHVVDGPWPGAGTRRNASMVAECVRERGTGAIIEVAGFPWPADTKKGGTVGCLKLARAAGLEVVRG